MHFFPLPSSEDRNALRSVFEERCEAFQAEHPQNDTTVVLTSEQVHALWLDYVRPSAEAQENISFTLFWTWMCLVHEYALPVYGALAIIFFVVTANVYHWLKTFFLGFL